MLEIIALRHQIAVLKRSRTRRPCFGLWDRLFWILLSLRWPRLARELDDHSAGDGQALAPQRLFWAVEISVRWRADEADVSGFFAKGQLRPPRLSPLSTFNGRDIGKYIQSIWPLASHDGSACAPSNDEEQYEED